MTAVSEWHSGLIEGQEPNQTAGSGREAVCLPTADRYTPLPHWNPSRGGILNPTHLESTPNRSSLAALARPNDFDTDEEDTPASCAIL